MAPPPRRYALLPAVVATLVSMCAGCTIAAATLAIGVGGGVVGAAGLGASAYGVYMTREQVRAAVWPRLEISYGFGIEEGTKVKIANRGVGPAEVKRLRVAVDGVPAADWVEAVERLQRKKLITGSDVHFGIHAVESKVISPGVENEMLTLSDPKQARQLFAEAGRLSIEVCYCSTLGECWEVSAPDVFADSLTKPVSRCPVDEKPFHSFGPKARGDLLDALTKAPPPSDAGAGVKDAATKGD